MIEKEYTLEELLQHPLARKAWECTKPFHDCWCGSGKKYRDCHKNRANESPPTEGQMRNEINNTFSRTKICYTPNDSECVGDPINSHTIQKKGVLKEIEKNGHVYRLSNKELMHSIAKEKISWKKALTFKGFCSNHDSTIFSPIENEHFIPTKKQAIISSFRTICHELHKKEGVIDLLKEQGTIADRGKDLFEQIATQISMFESIKYTQMSVDELKHLHEIYSTAINSDVFNNFEYTSFLFTGNVDVVSSGCPHVDYDLDFNNLFDLYKLDNFAQCVSFSMDKTKDGFAVTFVWLKSFTYTYDFMNSLLAKDFKLIASILIQFFFISCENTYFCENWWESLSEEQQIYINKLSSIIDWGVGVDGFIDDKELIDWRLISIEGYKNT